MKKFNRSKEQALANAVEFKEEKDVETIRPLIYFAYEEIPISLDWQPEYGRPYKLPEGLDDLMLMFGDA